MVHVDACNRDRLNHVIIAGKQDERIGRLVLACVKLHEYHRFLDRHITAFSFEWIRLEFVVMLQLSEPKHEQGSSYTTHYTLHNTARDSPRLQRTLVLSQLVEIFLVEVTETSKLPLLKNIFSKPVTN